jgi:hypothetical protein
MKTRWKFGIVDRSWNRQLVRTGRLPLEIVGTDTEALEVVRSIIANSSAALRIEAESVGQIHDLGLSPVDSVDPLANSTDGVNSALRTRLICNIRQRRDFKGWEIQADQLQHDCWQLTLPDAIGYAAFRARGKLAEFRIHNTQGDIMQVILADQRHWEEGLRFPGRAVQEPNGLLVDSIQTE